MVEAIIFGAIASLVVIGIVGLLSRGSKIIELGRRTSGTATDLKLVIETMGEDIAELVHVDDKGAAYDSSSPSSKFSFVVRSSRKESGLPDAPTGATGLRRITYRLDGDGELKDVMRAVQVLDGSEQPFGNASERTLVRKSVAKLRAWPIAAVPRPGKPYGLKLASVEDPAHKKGATMACVVLEVSLGQDSGKTSIEKQTQTRIVTKLWCRNRVLELSRGSLK
jgi:hypothetical protein